MKMSFLVTLVVVVFFVVAGLYFLVKSGNWSDVEGQVKHSNIVEIHHRANTKMGEIGGLFDYRLELSYEYSVGGKNYLGERIYAGVDNVFSDRGLAEQALADYPVGKIVTVYVDPKNPARSSLLTSKSIGTKGLVILIALVLFVVAFVGGGFFVFSRL